MPDEPIREIGRVNRADGSLLATLRSDGSWSCPDPTMERALAARYAGQFRGPQYGPFGARILAHLAGTVGGKAELIEPTWPLNAVFH